MENIKVNLGKRSYEIVIGYSILQDMPALFKKLKLGNDAVIITNHTIHHLYGRQLQNILNRNGYGCWFNLVADSERSKSQRACWHLLNRIAAYDKKKAIFIVALGGGVVGDLAGFIASVYKRGVPYIQIPTTFLAQVDSSIGGKTGIDLDIGKNLVGSFYQPRLVLSDLSFLRSLSLKQIRNGLSEAIKYGILGDRKLFEYIEANYKDILKLNIKMLERIVYVCSRIKAAIVQLDEFDTTGKRAVLNLGHTIGHAIEAASGFIREYSHGEAVAIGMMCACDISHKLKLIGKTDSKRIEKLLVNIGLPVSCSGLRLNDIVKAQGHDKKFIHGKNRFILPVKIGRVVIKQDIPHRIIESSVKGRLDE